jgi:predicted HNH restriction endonuclease
MKTEAFRKWLCNDYLRKDGQSLAGEGQLSRAANCKTVEKCEGDLDEHFQRDEMRSLLDRLSYSSSDARRGNPARHNIPIDGDVHNGTGTYKRAIQLYREFLISRRVAENVDEIWKDVTADVELAALEGAERMALVRHRKREQFLRDAKVAEARKLGNGRLKCEVPGCGFDFEAAYGELGRDYAQVHHLKPLGDRTTPSETKLTDLAVVCANCHAMIHRGGKCRAPADLIPLRLRVSAVN